MGDRVISQLVYKLIADEADLVKSLKNNEKRLDALGDKFISVGKKATLGLTVPIVAVGTAMVAAAVEAEKANKLLENAITAAGNAGKVSAKNLAAYASELQLVSKYDDEATISAFTLLEQMTALDEQGLKAIMPSIQNFASALDMDLQNATSLVAKSIATDTNALGRYGIEVDSSASKSEKMAQILQGLAKYQGAAAAEAQTFSGRMAILKNQIGDLAEQFGNELLPIISEVVKTFSGIVKQFAALEPEQKRSIIGWLGVAAAIGPVLVGVGNSIKAINTLKIAMAGLQAAGGGPIALAIAGVIALALAFDQLGKDIEKQKRQQIAWEKAEGLTRDQLNQKLKVAKFGLEAANIQLEKQKKIWGDNEVQLKAYRDRVVHFEETIKNVEVEIQNLNNREKELTTTQNEEADAQKRLNDEKERYKNFLELTSSAIEKNKTEEQKLLEQIKILENFKTTSIEDENRKLTALGALRKQLYTLQTTQQAEALTSQREKDIEYNENLKRLGKEAAEAGDKQRKDEAAADKAAADAKKALLNSVFETAVNITGNLIALSNTLAQAELDNIDKAHAARSADIEAEYQAALAAAGVAEETEAQKAQAKIDAAKTAGDAVAQKEAEDELARIKIKAAFDQQQLDLDRKLAIEQAKIKRKQAIAEKIEAAFSIGVNTAKAIAATLATPWLAAAIGVAGGIQLATVLAKPLPEVPTFAGGGSFVVPPGFERDSFPITTAMAQSGETVTIETPEQRLGGGINLYIDNYFGDDASYRQLARKLASVSPIEELRRG